MAAVLSENVSLEDFMANPPDDMELEFRLSRSKSAIAQRLANVHTRTATVAGDQL
ncbi:hypothetical protein [Microcoleus sp. S13_B4]|uniref:hypothetical protein n=1 Tax=Microcoleus sp. S13_B4 TaxID=3055408 RepID=UPI002FD4E980